MFRAFRRFAKRTVYSPWPYLLFLSPVVFYLGLLVTAGIGNGWPAFALTMVAICVIVWLGTRNRQLHSPRTVLVVLVALIPTAFCAFLCIPVGNTTRQVAADFPRTPTQYWELPTGSRIAYYHLGGSDKQKPVMLFLHGGPGGSITSGTIDFFQQFADHGYEVFLYDQVGGGRSDQLPIEEYSHTRNVDDLAAIVEKLPQRNIVMVGASYGSELLVSAMADARIAPKISKAILAEPGSLPMSVEERDQFYAEQGLPDKETTNPRKADLKLTDAILQPRPLLGLFLLPKNTNYFRQNEASSLVDKEFLADSPEGLVCPEDYDSFKTKATSIDDREVSLNLRSSTQISASEHSVDMTALSQNQTPVLMMLGECSYIYRKDQVGFMYALPGLQQVQYYTGFGHNVLSTKESLPFESMRAFMEDRSLPLDNYPTKADVADFIKQDK